MIRGADRDEILRQMYAEGAPVAMMARRIGISTARTYQHLKRLDLPQKRVTYTTDRLRQIYNAAMRGDANWLSVDERSHEERVRLIVAELRKEAANPERDLAAVLRAISLWEQPAVMGPKSLEIIQHAQPAVRRRVA